MSKTFPKPIWHFATFASLGAGSPAELRMKAGSVMRALRHLPLGAHLVTPRRGYTHHGIYVGGDDVVHYAGLSRTLHRGPVQKVPLQQFAAGRPVWIKRTTGPKYSGQEAVQRACSRLGADRYRLTSNNCEHFCEWCVCGEDCSEQVDKLLAWPHTVVRAAIRWLGQILGVGLNTAHMGGPCGLTRPNPVAIAIDVLRSLPAPVPLITDCWPTTKRSCASCG